MAKRGSGYFEQRGTTPGRRRATDLDERRSREMTAAEASRLPFLECLSGRDVVRTSLYDWAWLG